MKSEDTVMDVCDKAQEIYKQGQSVTQRGVQEWLKTQAGISFKAGIKEVVEWLKQYYTPTIRDLNLVQYTICAEEWQSKLKEWGV